MKIKKIHFSKTVFVRIVGFMLFSVFCFHCMIFYFIIQSCQQIHSFKHPQAFEKPDT